MNIQRFTAPTSREALAKARAVFGEGTLVLANRATPNGVEVTATSEDGLGKLNQGARTSSRLQAAIQAREAEETRPPKNPIVSPQQSVAEDTEQLAMSTLSFQDYVRERMLRRRQEGHLEDESQPLPTFARKPRLDAQLPTAPAVVKHNPLRGLAVELAVDTPPEHRKSAAGSAALNTQVMGELQSMKDLIEERFNTLSWLSQTQRNPLHSNLMVKLLRAGYSPTLGRALLERMPKSAGPADALKWLLGVLERNLQTDAKQAPIYEAGGVYALVGSTGVGKTTTAAKLAALAAQVHGANNVGLITLDTYRVGGHEQLRAYGRMLGVVAHLAHDKAALQDLLSLLSGKKMVLIDTTGVAPRDPRKDDILQVLDMPAVQRLLVVNAASQGDTLDETLNTFKNKGCKQTILSKIDEAVKLGPALDALVRHQMQLRGITNGQRVPEDFERANAPELVATSMRAHSRSAFDPSALDLDFFFAEAPRTPGALHA